MCPHCKSKYSKIDKRRWPDGKFDYWCMACGNQVPEPEEIKALESVGGDLARYDRMVLAINECHQTDEVKQIRDQALALQHCARIAKNMEAERKAAEIRIRAERRTGEILKELEKGKGGRPPEKTPGHVSRSLFAKAKEDADITDDQAKDWQQLAEMPNEEFEKALSDPETKPSTSGLINNGPRAAGVFKPTSNIPLPSKVDDNPRRCTASCCPEGLDVTGPWDIHDAQAVLDSNHFPHGFFREYHAAILKILVDVDQRHGFEMFRGGLPRSVIPERLKVYRGLDGGKAKR